MNIFIIPSWYPSPTSPYSGIFFQEQAMLYARHFPTDRVAISHWGPNDHRLLLNVSEVYKWPIRFATFKKTEPNTRALSPNCIEYFNPVLTWSRRVFNGNLKRIIAASIDNFTRFAEHYGKPDIIHAHVAFPGGYVAHALSAVFEIPYVITEHMGPFPLPGLLWGSLKSIVLSRFQKQVKLSLFPIECVKRF